MPCLRAPSVSEIVGDLPPLRSGLSKGSDTFENWVYAIRKGMTAVISDIRKAGRTKVASHMEEVAASLDQSKFPRGSNWGSASPGRIGRGVDRSLAHW